MKRTFITASIALLTIAGCTKNEDFVMDSADGLIDVTIPTGIGDADADSKASIESSQLYWNANDAVGIFAGSGNVNRKFTLKTGEGTTSGTFSGQMSPVSTPVTMILYYPYVSNTTTPSCILAKDNLMDQVFEGTFDEDGRFDNFGQYSFLVSWITGFTIEQTWPSLKNATFYDITSIVRFKISSSLSDELFIQKVGLRSANDSQYPFRLPYYYVVTESGQLSLSYYPASDISTSISEKNKLTLGSGSTRYVQMAAIFNEFADEQQLNVYVEGINDGRNFRYVVPKTVQSSHSFTLGRRTTINVPLESGTSVELADRVKVTTLDGTASLTAPIFNRGDGYTAASAFWGDDTIEKYEAGRTYSFATSGKHTASFNHWGESTSLTFEKLTGISAIDFTDVY